MGPELETARSEWEEGARAFRRMTGDTRDAELLHAQLDVVTAELQRRVGSSYSLAELAAAYRSSDVWIHEAVSEHAAVRGWPRTLSTVGACAFHFYSRGAVDWKP